MLYSYEYSTVSYLRYGISISCRAYSQVIKPKGVFSNQEDNPSPLSDLYASSLGLLRMAPLDVSERRRSRPRGA